MKWKSSRSATKKSEGQTEKLQRQSGIYIWSQVKIKLWSVHQVLFLFVWFFFFLMMSSPERRKTDVANMATKTAAEKMTGN